MSEESDPPPEPSRPWWTGSARGWDSPWDLEDPLQEEAERARSPKQPQGGRVEVPTESGSRIVAQPVGRPMIQPIQPTRMEEQRTESVDESAGGGQEVLPDRPEAAAGLPVVATPFQLREMPSTAQAQEARPVGWGRLTVMAVLVFAFTFGAWLYVVDMNEVDDGDLRMQVPPDVTAAISAPQRLEAFLDSLKAITDPKFGGLEPWDWDVNDLRVMLDQNGLALDNLKDLLEDENWRGRHFSWHQKDLGAHPNWETAALLKQVEVAYNDKRGNESAALASAMDLAELARRLQDLYAWPSYYFRSLEIQRRCAESLAETLQRSRLPAVDLAGFQEQFEACTPSDAQVRRNVLPGFYLFEKKVLLGMQSGEPFEAMPAGMIRSQQRQLFFKSNETLDLIAGSIRYLINQVGQTSASTAGLREMWAREPVGRGLNAYAPNGLGVAFAQERLQPYLDVPARQQLAKTRHLLVVQLVAMRRFIADHRGLPSKLSDLRPSYLAELPLDPFSGEAFQYDPTTRVIYSVGSDFVASGGRPNRPPLSDPGEPTVKIGVRTATSDH
jgi:hypothetical protein